VWVAGEVTSSRAFALLLLFFCFFFFMNRLSEESGSFLFDPLGLQIVEDAFLFSYDAVVSEGEVLNGLPNVFFGLLELQLGAIQSVPGAIETSFHCV